MILSYTLLADGSSDSALMPIIEWLIGCHRPDLRVAGSFASDIGRTGLSLCQRLPVALALYPCDILLVHRDAESEKPSCRETEIARAASTLHPCWIPMVPERMTEAWLLSDERAIRAAAGNRHGKVKLNLPDKRQWDSLNDPKQVLFDALKVATEKSGRALTKFSVTQARLLVASMTPDFSGLRGMPSFDNFETKFATALKDF